ncbi:MAG TPA: hypothetical protein VM536_08500 [Chloroflexia bacterium]|nr:hypothetical protein [Chloroflexia bacterium]
MADDMGPTMPLPGEDEPAGSGGSPSTGSNEAGAETGSETESSTSADSTADSTSSTTPGTQSVPQDGIAAPIVATGSDAPRGPGPLAGPPGA